MRYFILSFFLLLLLTCAGFYGQMHGERSPHRTGLSYFCFRSQGQQIEMAYTYSVSSHPNGKTVLLLHGREFSQTYWQETTRFLLDRGFSVIAPDQIGSGSSSQPLNYQFSFRQLAANTHLLLDSLHCDKAIVLGHSLGGMLALRFVLMYPDCCEQLILENPLGLTPGVMPAYNTSLDECIRQELEESLPERKNHLREDYFNGKWCREYETLLDERNEREENGRSAICARNRALITDMITTQPVCYELQNIAVPVTLLVGTQDKYERSGCSATLCKKATKQVSNFRLLTLPGTGHVPHVENFSLFRDSLAGIL